MSELKPFEAIMRIDFAASDKKQICAHAEKVQKLVRCKDCKHRDPEDRKCDCGHGILWQLPRDDDWFCADGERREHE